MATSSSSTPTRTGKTVPQGLGQGVQAGRQLEEPLGLDLQEETAGDQGAALDGQVARPAGPPSRRRS